MNQLKSLPLTGRKNVIALVLSIITSIIITVFLILLILFVANLCSFAAGRCDPNDNPGIAEPIAIAAVVMTWTTTAWVVRSKNRPMSSLWLYLIGTGFPVLVGLTATLIIFQTYQ